MAKCCLRLRIAHRVHGHAVVTQAAPTIPYTFAMLKVLLSSQPTVGMAAATGRPTHCLFVTVEPRNSTCSFLDGKKEKNNYGRNRYGSDQPYKMNSAL